MKPWGRIEWKTGEIGKDSWAVKAEPHMVLRLKRIFGRISKGEQGTVFLSATPEVALDLLWVMKRYPLEISDVDARRMRKDARSHTETLKRLEELVDPKYRPPEFSLAVPARDYQKVGALAFLRRAGLLIADDVGLGKTATAICALTDRRTLPAAVVTLSGVLPGQWQEEFRKFAPALRTHILKKGEPYPLPRENGRGPDVLILNYHKLSGWSQTLGEYVRSVVFDEVQELRRRESYKYHGARHLSETVRFRLGLSATPIYNYGSEIWSVMDVLQPGALGSCEEFLREWCVEHGRHHTLADPRAFGTYMREQFLMLRRTRSEVGRELPAVSRIRQLVKADASKLDAIEDSAGQLARIILADGENVRGEKMMAAEQLSNVVRQATGIAKAPYVAEFIRLLVDSGERPLVYCWHREVYGILQARLKPLKVAMFTGSETTAQKKFSKDQFLAGQADVMLMSLRAGAGVDGLQKACRTVVFAELDWSPGVHEQAIGRIHRDGQPDPVMAYFLVADEGSDPDVADALGLKKEQIEGIRDPKGGVLGALEADPDHIRKLAKKYLERADRRTARAAQAAGTLHE